MAESNFVLLSGTPKRYMKKGDSGREITAFFCGDCGTTLWSVSQIFPDRMAIKAGILDNNEEIEKQIPSAEYYHKQRVSWVKEVDGAVQVDKMGSLS